MKLHQNHHRILSALQAADNRLGMTDQLAIVGGMARHLAGDPTPPGDVDVLIEKPLCVRYWDFLEILTSEGLRSVRDVLDKPSFTWTPCLPEIAHARALTIDCNATLANEKHGALDICFKADYLDDIPKADQWADILKDLTLTGAAKQAAIQKGRERLKQELRNRECDLQNPVMASAIGLYYRLRK
jgi:hypothetical protein